MNATTTANKFIAGIAAAGIAGALCLGSAATAFAEGEQVDEASYGYHAAQASVSDRMATVAAEDTDGNTDSTGNANADTSAYSYNAGQQRGASYADAEHADADALVEAGIIESTDEIDAYAAAKHAEVSSRFSGLDSMTAEERHEHFSQFSHDAYAGDTVEELQAEGLAS
jgi:hypothetical protein